MDLPTPDRWVYPKSPKADPTRKCKDCKRTTSAGKRAAPYPGPRCMTHHRAFKARKKKLAHDAQVRRVYGLSAGDYDALYEAQGGMCYICQRAKGTGRRKLAVDHDHQTDEVRGLLCSTCNQFLGHIRESTAVLTRAILYLTDPPARKVLQKGPEH